MTADGEGGLIARILESLMGESGKFYLDIAQILQPYPPLLLLGDKKAVYVSSTFLTRTFFSISFPKEFSLTRNQFAFLWNFSGLSLR